MYLPHLLKIFVARLETADGDVPGVGHEQVDSPLLGLGALDQRSHRGLVGDVDLHRGAANGLRHALRLVAVQIGYVHVPSSFANEAFGKSLADAASASGNHTDFVLDLHAAHPNRSGARLSSLRKSL